MAKIRADELARELNMENDELLEKMFNMGIKLESPTSYMVCEVAAKFKAEILKNKTKMVPDGSKKNQFFLITQRSE